MASTDARPVPIKNTAFRVYFPIYDADGDLVSSAATLDSEISLSGATFNDASNEATEIGSSGIYYLDLTQAEMNSDAVVVIVKTATTGAKTTPIVLYPEETGDINVDVTGWNGTAIAGVDTAGYPKVTVKSGTGVGEIATTSGTIDEVAALTGHTAQTGDSYAKITSATFGLAALNTDIDSVIAFGAPPAASVIADAVWDEAKSGHTGATTFGDLATDVNTVVAFGAPPSAATIAALILATPAQKLVTDASGHVTLANGAHGGAAGTLTMKSVAISNSEGTAVTLTSSGGNGHGLSVVGNGSGSGLLATAGATGSGIKATGGATSGDGISASATDGDGIDTRGGTDGHGIHAYGDGSGEGIRAIGGATGNGMEVIGGSSSGAGLVARAVGGNSDAAQLTSNGSGSGLQASGGTTGVGIRADGGVTSGAGFYALAHGNNDAGMLLAANGTGEDLDADNLLTSASIPSAATIADAVWDEASTGHTDAGKAGAQQWTVLSGIQTVLSGITSLAAWLRGLFRKSMMDSTAKTEVNTGGGTYDEATDSNEAIRDTAPMGTAMRGTDSAALASAWTSTRAAYLDELAAANIPADIDTMKATIAKLDTTVVQDGAVYDFTAAALAAAPNSTGLTAQEARDAMKLAPTAGDPAAGSVDAHLDTLVAFGAPPSAATIKTTMEAAGSSLAQILSDTGTDGVVLSSTTMNSIATALLDLANGIETGYTLRQVLRIIAAACAGKLSGAATTTNTIRSITDAKARITATVDEDGNRSAVTLDGT